MFLNERLVPFGVDNPGLLGVGKLFNSSRFRPHHTTLSYLPPSPTRSPGPSPVLAPYILTSIIKNKYCFTAVSKYNPNGPKQTNSLCN